MAEEKPLEFPLIFTKCPVCGSEETVAKRAKRAEVEAGRVGLDAEAMLFQCTTPIVERGRLMSQVTVPALFSFFDVCAQCGCLYCVKVERRLMMVARPPGPPFKA